MQNNLWRKLSTWIGPANTPPLEIVPAPKVRGHASGWAPYQGASLYSERDRAWWHRCQRLENVRFEMAYVVSKSIHADSGPVPIRQPRLELYDDFATSREIEGREQELIAHYRDRLEVAKAHGQTVENFWVRPLVFRKGSFALTFPWYDSIYESRAFMNSISSRSEGDVFGDSDRGWQVDVRIDGDSICLRQRIPEDERDLFAIRTSRKAAVKEAVAALQRIERITRRLMLEFGQDYWGSDFDA